MTDRNDRGADRAETARQTDDSDILENDEPTISHSGAQGHNLHRDIGSRDELRQATGDTDGVTRVRDSDKPEQANLPRFNQR